MKYCVKLLAFSLVFGVLSCGASAQEIIFQSNFDSDEGFVPLPSSDSDFTFGYDYVDFDTIPEAPNSGLTGGADNTGLKLEANLSAQQIESVAIATDSLGLSGRYSVQVDAWLNYNFPAGTAGTTEFGGLSVGHDGFTDNLSGGTFVYSTDGDSGSDYRLYKDLVFQSIAVDEEASPEDQAIQMAIAGQYTVDSINNSDEPWVTAFPSVLIDEVVEQGVFGDTPDGSGGFRWTTIEAIVDTEAVGPAGITDDPGFATFSITEATTGEKIEVGTIDNSNGQGVANLAGDVAIVFTDIFTSVSGDQDLSFGMFDNLIITSLPDEAGCDPDSQGDLDGNGSVEFADFLILSGNFGTMVDDHTQGDIDCNGTVEFADFLVLSGNFGTAVGAESVPEPNSLGLAVMASVGLALIRRRR